MQENVDPTTLQFLQGDEIWATLVQELLADRAGGHPHGCEAERKLGLKLETLGYVGDAPPECPTLHYASAAAPVRAKRVRVFASV